MPKIVVCVDDYALNPAVCSAVLSLAQAGRISATSCLANAPLWPSASQALKPFANQIGVGLHLNLTEAFDCSTDISKPDQWQASSLHKLMWLTWSRQLCQTAINQEINRQLDQFETYWGKPPDFIDGHQHVHQFPIIRNVLVKIIQQRYPRSIPFVPEGTGFAGENCGMQCKAQNVDGSLTPSRLCNAAIRPQDRSQAGIFGYEGYVPFVPWIRHTQPKARLFHPPLSASALKSWMLYRLGGKGLKTLLKHTPIKHNSVFMGVYGFNLSAQAYLNQLEYWLDKAPEASLLMCHPAQIVNDAQGSNRDPIERARLVEYEVLSSSAYQDLLNKNNIRLVSGP